MMVPIKFTSDTSGITTVDHQARVLGGEKMVRLADDWSLTGGASLLSDDNSNLTDKYEKAITGFLIDGTIG